MRILTFFFFSFLLLSCRYDEDFNFVPKTQGAYFLMENNGQRELRRYEPEENIFLNEWGISQGLTNPSDIAGAGEKLWIGIPEQNRLARFDLKSEVLDDFSLGNFTPHFLCIGESYLMMSDTLSNQLGFFHLRKEELTTIALNQKPGKSTYRSTKFYLILGENELAIYNEQALAPIETINFDRKIFDVLIDNRFSIWVYTRDTANYRTTISWNSNAIELPAREVPESKIQHSPYLQATFDKEFTGLVGMANGSLINFPFPEADGFEADFFEGKAYYLAKDSLRLLDLAESQTQVLGPYSGIFLNSFFYLAADGN